MCKKIFGVLGQTLIVLVLEFSNPGSFKNKVKQKQNSFCYQLTIK
ncbi:hypothetical protein LEP1GSC173_4375 [Leptospira interrogans str. HAI1594]|nr:hypothetical protein LEP1GSC117_1370 [Leptospira interrogans serovar Icterohaemorrhagiae str. Verdun LP]EKP77350.1 hypothetical protein LEP1GSC173_4375 [Leptospira interrogans str. HAI1594]EMO18014.1 hypothetical protein LEP1GSC167_3360 [Leptospira interrogans serovar Copenhageni str. HAI0188]EMO34852.1 hypothetical protein LEP1GSC177_4330 [Leptospira interrogans str. MMD3731]EMY54022.1 hypothetical protein LEP1GSC204_0782 [Leptospira interrogans serovar Copenhageni str. M20]